jgi:predicted acylesterase/phospholipase RssA
MPLPAAEFDRYGVITIQGGGVYGLSLLGQLHTVLEDLKIIPVALAGTSAGAIVATLAWAGLSTARIRNSFAELARTNQLFDVLGPFEPAEQPFDFSSFRALKARFVGYLREIREEIQQPETRSVLGKFGNFVALPVTWPVGVVRKLATARNIKADVTPHLRNRGIFRGEGMESLIDRLIRSSPQFQNYREELPQDRLLQFRDVRELTHRHPDDCVFPSLFLTATNLRTLQLELFNTVQDKYLNVPIAKAVRASAGFPVFFRPVEIPQAPEGGWFVDGGMISNFPSWVFSHEFRRQMADSEDFRALASRPWVHIGLKFAEERSRPEQDPANPEGFLGAIFALLRGQARNQLEEILSSFVTRSYIARQPSNDTGGPPDILDVDQITGETVTEMFRRAARFVRTELGAISFRLPEPEVIEPILRGLIDKALVILKQSDNTHVRLRSNIFVPFSEELIPRYRCNMAGDSDEDLILHFTSGLTGFCFVRRCPLMCNLKRIGELAQRGQLDPREMFGMTAEQHAKVERNRTWLASVPIFDPYASYPRDLSARSGRGAGVEGQYYRQFSSRTDGAILGVLNLDSAWDYASLQIEEDPMVHWTDVRIRAILDVMQTLAVEVGRILSDYFAAK